MEELKQEFRQEFQKEITPEELRQQFKKMNKFMLLTWRLGLGKWINFLPDSIGQIMVITHKGRKSGETYKTPVNYAVIDGDLYCTSGFGAISDWYQNILTNPEVEVWLPNGWWEGTAVDVTESKDYLWQLRTVLIASGFAAPAVGIEPKTMSDEDLAAATEDYRLVRISRTAPRTGDGGPGDLSWVWPLAVFLMFPLLFFRGKKR